MIIDCISDLHGSYPVLEGGDLLIVAGDLTARDTYYEWESFLWWLAKQKYEKIVFIAGNHDGELVDWGMGEHFHKDHPTTYLQDSGTEFKGLKIWGSPWTPEFCNWHFMKPRGAELRTVWDKIPEDTDILITHGPPYGILDRTGEKGYYGKERLGCADLRDAVERIKPKLHVFGHIHGGYGELALKHPDAIKTQTWCVNAAIMNENYRPVNKPIRIEL